MGGEVDGDDDYTNLPGNWLKAPLCGISVAILAQAILAQAVWFNKLTSEVGIIGKRWAYPAQCDILYSGLFLLFRGAP